MNQATVHGNKRRGTQPGWPILPEGERRGGSGVSGRVEWPAGTNTDQRT
jgi:hypothetical protein